MTTHVEHHPDPLLFEGLGEEHWESLQQISAGRASETILTLADCAIRFADVERVPRYHAETRENDAEHSFMLSLIAPKIVVQYFPALDPGLVAQFANVHDLVELQTDDVATFCLSNEALAQKEANEHAALESLAATLPPHTRQLLLRYERQIEQEARFVRLLDKALPVAVNILRVGKQVMREDYGIETGKQLADTEASFSSGLRNRFPDQQLTFLHVVRDALASQFAIQFEDSEV